MGVAAKSDVAQARDGPRSIHSRFRAFKISSQPITVLSATMSRQFFVGGNFKMNPVSRDAKRTLVQTLNDATLDPNTGEHLYAQPHLLVLIAHITQRLSSHPLPST